MKEKVKEELKKGISDEEYAELSPLEKRRYKSNGTLLYRVEMDAIAFGILSDPSGAKTRSHVARQLFLSLDTIQRWEKRYNTFRKAIKEGLEIGASYWRDRIEGAAFEPTANVNNGLIKLISSNVYGIKDEVDINLGAGDKEWCVSIASTTKDKVSTSLSV